MLCPAAYSPPLPPLAFLTPPPFSQYGPAQTVGSNPYGTVVIANVLCCILGERGREKQQREKTLSSSSWCRKVDSIVMYFLFWQH